MSVGVALSAWGGVSVSVWSSELGVGASACPLVVFALSSGTGGAVGVVDKAGDVVPCEVQTGTWAGDATGTVIGAVEARGGVEPGIGTGVCTGGATSAVIGAAEAGGGVTLEVGAGAWTDGAAGAVVGVVEVSVNMTFKGLLSW